MQAQAIKDEIVELERRIGHAKAKLHAVGYDIAEISGPEKIITTSGRENLPVFRSKLI
jgi:cell division protein FtsL